MLHQLSLLGVAFLLSSLIGLERQLRQRSAGLRTHALVGVGAAGFILVSKYGFADVLGHGISLDPSRVAAQVVSGIGFIGAGLIFVKRDSVRGLTTAATIWLVAAVGLASGAGLLAVALGLTAAHLIVAFGYTDLVRRLPQFRFASGTIEVTYRDRSGVLRRVLAVATEQSFVISDLQVARSDRDESLVVVTFGIEGKGSLEGLVEVLQRIDGVIDVRTAVLTD
jgi:putative Mg2+ transporter-C (MgtC) family protein